MHVQIISIGLLLLSAAHAYSGYNGDLMRGASTNNLVRRVDKFKTERVAKGRQYGAQTAQSVFTSPEGRKTLPTRWGAAIGAAQVKALTPKNAGKPGNVPALTPEMTAKGRTTAQYIRDSKKLGNVAQGVIRNENNKVATTAGRFAAVAEGVLGSGLGRAVDKGAHVINKVAGTHLK